jgi:hypothetical protein
MAAFALGVLEVCKDRATIPANPDKTDTIDRWDLLILRKLLIAGKWSGNPAYRPVRHSSKLFRQLPSCFHSTLRRMAFALFDIAKVDALL